MSKSTIRLHLEDLLGKRETNRLIKIGYVFDVLAEMLRSKKDETIDTALYLIRDDPERATFILQLTRFHLSEKERALAARRIREKIRNYKLRLLA